VISRFGETHVADVEPAALEMVPDSLVAGKRLCDVRSMPYADGAFDVVLAFDVLEHVEDDADAVREISRVLRPGGFFIFTVPAFNILYGPHDRALGHFRRYRKASIRKLLGDMERVALGYWVFFIFLPVALQRLLSRNKKPEVHYARLPRIVNGMLYGLLALENALIRLGVRLPAGTTIYGVYKRA
jgi:SAM-dependent methyltransferase